MNREEALNDGTLEIDVSNPVPGNLSVTTTWLNYSCRNGFERVGEYSFYIVSEITAATVEGSIPDTDKIPIVPTETDEFCLTQGTYYKIPEVVKDKLAAEGYRFIYGIDGRWPASPRNPSSARFD